MDLLPGIEFLSLLLFLFGAKDVGLGKHDKFEQRVFKAPCHVAIEGQNLAGIDFSVLIFSIYRRKSLVPKVFGKTLRTGARAGQKDHAKAFFLIVCQVLDQSFKASVVGSHVPDVDVTFHGGREVSALIVNGGKGDHAALGQARRHFLAGVKKLHLAGENIAFFRALGHAFAELRLHGLSLLATAQGLVDEICRMACACNAFDHFRQSDGVVIKVI